MPSRPRSTATSPRRAWSRYVLAGLGAQTTIRLARHGARAVVLGAALLARYEVEPWL
jgi:hypothetical protein